MSDLCMNDCVRMQMWYSGGRLCSRGSAKFTDGLHEVRSHSGRFFLLEISMWSFHGWNLLRSLVIAYMQVFV